AVPLTRVQAWHERDIPSRPPPDAAVGAITHANVFGDDVQCAGFLATAPCLECFCGKRLAINARVGERFRILVHSKFLAITAALPLCFGIGRALGGVIVEVETAGAAQLGITADISRSV